MMPGLLRRKKKGGDETKASKPAGSTKPRITTREVFVAFSLAFFEPLGRRFARAFELERVFSKAGLSTHPVKYGAETIAMTVLTAVFTIVGFITYRLVFPMSLVETVIGVLIVVILPMMVFTIRLAYPYAVASSRRVETENELPFFMAYVATMIRGGYSLEKVMERVAQLRVFRAIRNEARRVITRIKMMGDDPISALEQVAMNHPSSRFRDIMLGYTTTLRSGGDVAHYLEVRTREIFESRTAEVKAVINKLMSFLEVYTIFGVIVSITLFVFFSVNAAITAAQAARTPGEISSINIDVTFPAIYNFLILPALGFVIAVAIHLNQPRTPVGYNEAYLTLLTWLPVSIAVFLVVLITTGGLDVLYGSMGLNEVKSLVYATAAGFVTVSIPPAAKYRSIVKKQKGLIKAAADFLRDVSEVRKTGLSPERCIILVSSRNYRSLTPVVERAAAALSIGLSLEESLRKALRGVKEWFVIASFRFLADSIVVGGGSPEVIDTLARFTQVLSELEEETRKRMRTQVILPYMGAILLASMPIIILYMLLSLAKVPVSAVSPMVLVLSLGSLVNSYIMGIIAGKSSQTTVAAGFQHAIILTVLTLITLTITFMFIGV
ncbi:MAG: type II secretion system F family protein [Desulfurococcaceae archaeon]